MRPFKFILTVIALLLGFGSHGTAQGYESIFGDSSTSWKVYRNYRQHNFFVDSISVKQDTIINNKFYRVLNLKPTSSYYPSSYYPKKDSLGYLREDTAKGKVWFRKNDKESLLMDLSLKKGDTFYLDSPWLNRRVVADLTKNNGMVVDSVFYKNNRKYLFFEELSDLVGLDNQFYFIEGVGTSYGFNYNLSFVVQKEYFFPSVLICGFKNEEQQFENIFFDKKWLKEEEGDSSLSACHEAGEFDISLGKFSKNFGDNLYLYPTPAYKRINFQVPEQLNSGYFNLKVWDGQGELVRRQHFSNHRFTLFKKGLKVGVYFYRLTNDQGEKVKSGKLIFAH